MFIKERSEAFVSPVSRDCEQAGFFYSNNRPLDLTVAQVQRLCRYLCFFVCLFFALLRAVFRGYILTILNEISKIVFSLFLPQSPFNWIVSFVDTGEMYLA